MTNLELSLLDAPPRRYGLRQAMRSEWIKLFSLRSTYWTLLVTLAGSLLVTVLSANGAGHHNRAWYQGFDPTNQSLTGLALGTLAIGVLGILSVTGEYGTGTIRASLTAAPRRPLFVTAKVLVVGAVALVAGEVLTFSCFGVGQIVLAQGHAPVAHLSQPGVLRAVALSGAFLALLGIGAVGLGIIIRHTAGALATYVGLTVLLPLLLGRIPSHPGRFTPVLMLANSVSAVVRSGNQVSPGLGFGLMALYATAALLAGTALLVRRDA